MIKCIRSQQAFNNNVAKKTLLMATGKLFLPLVLLETLHSEGLSGAEGAQATAPNGWQRRCPSNSTDSAHLPEAGDAGSQRACGNASSKRAPLCPATQPEPIHQLSCRLPGRVSAGLALSARLEVSNADRQGWGLGEEPSVPR